MSGKVEFAFWSPQAGATVKTLLDRAEMAERLGYHSFWLVDHFWTLGMPDLDLLEAVTMMSAIAARTERVRIGTLVLCNSFRNPALLAKSLTTIDHISNGRLEVGLGAGWMEQEYRANGYEFPSVGTRLRQLDEGLQILKAMFTENRANFKGRYYTVTDAPNNPKPVQKPHPPIMIGGAGEKVLLRLVAKYADRWNCPAGYRDFKKTLGVLHEHCRAVSRDPKDITVSEQLMVCIGANKAEADQKWEMAKGRKPFSFTAVKGTPDEVVKQLREHVSWGVTMFTMMFADMAPPQTVELFAREVMPAFA
ncbi:MAG TPA: TIGR03560 family F420-dependent LLM class oxidoreductase [Xanthobacteraceae bacterium]|jgi:F420-dependent oxidoreductase-like protein|nr:TIGR03560 family F420-dependent LLM class oxidoreductase [Xanthobacteraceae bacterium]